MSRVYRLDKDEAELRAALIMGEFSRNCKVIDGLNTQKVKKYITEQFLEVINDSRKSENTEEALGRTD